MKTTLKCLLGSWRCAALGAALLAGGLPDVCQAQSSPVGTWDCVMSGGGQPGVAYLTFTTNIDQGVFTFYGYAVVAGVPPASEISERTPEGDPGRGGTTTSTNGVGTTNVFGFVPMSGHWSYDSQGRVIGSFSELINVSSESTNSAQLCVSANIPYVVTNSSGIVDSNAVAALSLCLSNLPFVGGWNWQAVASDGTTNNYSTAFDATTASNFLVTIGFVVTNSNGSVDRTGQTNFSFVASDFPFVTNFTWSAISGGDSTVNSYSAAYLLDLSFGVGPSSADTTNSISFVGKVVPGKHLTLNCSTSFGHSTYNGVPAVTLPNLTGTSWYGVKQQQGVSYAEFFSLISFANGNPYLDLSDNITNFPNIYYSTNGVGPSYQFTTFVIVSKQKKAGFATLEFNGSNSVLRATYGGFSSNSKTTTSNTKGVIEPNTKIKYKATKQ